MKPYWEDSRSGITIYHGDCREILPTLGPVDHVITDPPYSKESHAMHDAGKRWAEDQDGLERATLKFANIDGPFLANMLTTVHVRRWAIFTMDERLSAWLRVNTPCGWRYVRTGLWIKPGSMPQFTGDRPAMGYEPVVIMHIAGGRTRWNGGGKAGIWTYSPVHGEHPTEKPLGLYRALLEDLTDPGETILDPFAGSFTTALAAYQLGRTCTAIELEEKWCEVGVKRLESQTPPLFTLPAEKPVQGEWEGWSDTSWMIKGGYVEDTE